MEEVLLHECTPYTNYMSFTYCVFNCQAHIQVQVFSQHIPHTWIDTPKAVGKGFSFFKQTLRADVITTVFIYGCCNLINDFWESEKFATNCYTGVYKFFFYNNSWLWSWIFLGKSRSSSGDGGGVATTTWREKNSIIEFRNRKKFSSYDVESSAFSCCVVSYVD